MLTTAEGQARRAGFELEFAGVELTDIVAAVRRVFGGQVRPESRFVYAVRCEGLGDFKIFMDWVLLKDRGYLNYLETLGLVCPRDCAAAEDLIETLAAGLVPYEVVTPPLPLPLTPEEAPGRLGLVEELREALRRSGAQGTTSGLFTAFGLHLNVEAWSLEAHDLLAVLRSFLLLRDYIAERTRVAFSRRLSGYIEPFPAEYAALVLDPAYDPDMKRFMADYLEWNPTRNRGLDMLPILATVDRRAVLSYPVEADKLRARPAYHYRLPNCRVDDPEWRVALEWNYWVLVERLAMDRRGLRELSRLWLEQPVFPLNLVAPEWTAVVKEWLAGRA